MEPQTFLSPSKDSILYYILNDII